MLGQVGADTPGMSYSEFQPTRLHEAAAPEGPWRRSDAADEIERAGAALAHELSELLGWKVKVEVTARLGGQLASAASRAVPPNSE
jgi:hypothetical protein